MPRAKRRYHTCEWCGARANYCVQGKERYQRFACASRTHRKKSKMLAEMDRQEILGLVVHTEGFKLPPRPEVS